MGMGKTFLKSERPKTSAMSYIEKIKVLNLSDTMKRICIDFTKKWGIPNQDPPFSFDSYDNKSRVSYVEVLQHASLLEDYMLNLVSTIVSSLDHLEEVDLEILNRRGEGTRELPVYFEFEFVYELHKYIYTFELTSDIKIKEEELYKYNDQLDIFERQKLEIFNEYVGKNKVVSSSLPIDMLELFTSSTFSFFYMTDLFHPEKIDIIESALTVHTYNYKRIEDYGGSILSFLHFIGFDDIVDVEASLDKDDIVSFKFYLHNKTGCYDMFDAYSDKGKSELFINMLFLSGQIFSGNLNRELLFISLPASISGEMIMRILKVVAGSHFNVKNSQYVFFISNKSAFQTNIEAAI